jgi:transposase
MPNPLPQSVRENIIYHKKNGAKNEEIVSWLRVSKSSVKRIWRLYKDTNSCEEKSYKRGRKPAFCDAKMNKISDKISEQPDVTLEELKEQFHLNISISALCRKLIKRDLTFKKRRCSQRSNSARTCNGLEASG